MATKSGTNASFKIDGVTVLSVSAWSFTDEREALKAPVFGDEFNKVHGMGTRNISGTVTGFFDSSDTTGQDLMSTAYASGATISGECHTDAVVHFKADGTDDNDGMYLTSYNVSAAQNEVIPVEFGFEIGGSWTESA